ncbi:MAG: nucleotidyltransferase domain-containing protein [Sulfuricurvum sp.]
MKTTTLPDGIRIRIINALQPLHPYKIILFGSYAYGEPDCDSDIDLLLVSSESGYKSFQERIALKMEILKKLDGLTQPIDILAYSKSEWEDLVAKNSSFIREINEKGVLCAKD